MNAAIYARFSSDNQREESITAQLRACRSYCAKRGYVVAHEYYDEAMTATNDNRPQYRQMIKDAGAGLFDVVIMHKVDRGARNEYDYYINKMKLIRAGVGLEYASQSFDTSTPEGQLMENQLVGIAAYYSRNLAKEVMKGLKENALKGMHNGGKPPLGYAVKDGKYIIDESTAPAVRMIFDMYASGKKYGEIQRALNEAGYKTGRGAAFGKNSIHDIVVNEKYIGVYVYGKVTGGKSLPRNSHQNSPDAVRIENALPAIIDKNTWDKAQARILSGKSGAGRLHAKTEYLLTGLVKCGVCGASMIGQTCNGTHRSLGRHLYTYYRCSKSVNTNISCASRRVKREWLEQFVISYIKKKLFTQAAIREITAQIKRKIQDEYKQSGGELKSLVREENRIKTAINNLLDIVEAGNFNDIISSRLSDNKAKLLHIQNKIAKLSTVKPPDITIRQVNEVLQAWKTRTDEDSMRAMLQTFVKQVVIYPDTITVELKMQIGSNIYDIRDSEFVKTEIKPKRKSH